MPPGARKGGVGPEVGMPHVDQQPSVEKCTHELRRVIDDLRSYMEKGGEYHSHDWDSFARDLAALWQRDQARATTVTNELVACVQGLMHEGGGFRAMRANIPLLLELVLMRVTQQNVTHSETSRASQLALAELALDVVPPRRELFEAMDHLSPSRDGATFTERRLKHGLDDWQSAEYIGFMLDQKLYREGVQFQWAEIEAAVEKRVGANAVNALRQWLLARAKERPMNGWDTDFSNDAAAFLFTFKNVANRQTDVDHEKMPLQGRSPFLLEVRENAVKQVGTLPVHGPWNDDEISLYFFYMYDAMRSASPSELEQMIFTTLPKLRAAHIATFGSEGSYLEDRNKLILQYLPQCRGYERVPAVLDRWLDGKPEASPDLQYVERFIESGQGLVEFRLVKAAMEPLGLHDKDVTRLLEAWKTIQPASDRTLSGGDLFLADTKEKRHIAGSVMALLELERARPGAPKTMLHEFGVRHFFRYPKEVLIKAFDERNDRRPYGVLLFPTADWNDAFSEYPQSQDGLADLQRQLAAEGYSIRIVEADTKFEVARRLLSLDRRYGNEHKIEFALIGGHGTANTIAFGGNDQRHKLHAVELMERSVLGKNGFRKAGGGAKRLGDVFASSPTLILVSCSTGVEPGIGSTMSKFYGATLFAPEKDTNLEHVHVERAPDGSLQFKVEYREQGIDRMFVAGERVRE